MSTTMRLLGSRYRCQLLCHLIHLIALVVLVLLPTNVIADSVCDVHVVNQLLPDDSTTNYSCSSLPSITERIAYQLDIVSSNGVPFYAATAFGAECGSLDDPDFVCDNVTTCHLTGYSFLRDSDTICLIVKSIIQSNSSVVSNSSDLAKVQIDLVYHTATEENQWHLNNTGQFGGIPGNDINATAWNESASGEGVVIQITDVELMISHEEVSDRVILELSLNGRTGELDPTSSNPLDNHGTACAGVAAAEAGNGICGRGVAPKASLVGRSIFGIDWSGSVSTYVDALYNTNVTSDGRGVDINSNSWGPELGCSSSGGGGCSFAVSDPLIVKAIQDGADFGRNGLGVIYVFEAGDDGQYGGTTSMTNYNKLTEVMNIAASDQNGLRAFYSNFGPNLFVNAPSGSTNTIGSRYPGIITALAGNTTSNISASSDRCYANFNGTSASAPMVAGVAALILSVRPDLTWRDVQYIIRQSADQNDPNSTGDVNNTAADGWVGWQQNAAGVWYSNEYGFGRVNAGAAVQLAQTWTLVPAQTGLSTAPEFPDQVIPDGGLVGIVSNTSVIMEVTSDVPDYIEHVILYVNITHAAIGDLRITLTSPSGTVAVLLKGSSNTSNTTGSQFNSSYPLPARLFWGESPVGTWTLNVTDTTVQFEGTLNSWYLDIYGAVAAIESSSSTSTPLPSESSSSSGGGSEPSDSSSGQPPPTDNSGGQLPPSDSSGGGQPPPSDNSGGQPPPSDNSGGQPPTSDSSGGQPPPSGNTGGPPPIGSTGTQPPPSDSGGTQPPSGSSGSPQPPGGSSGQPGTLGAQARITPSPLSALPSSPLASRSSSISSSSSSLLSSSSGWYTIIVVTIVNLMTIYLVTTIGVTTSEASSSSSSIVPSHIGGCSPTSTDIRRASVNDTCNCNNISDNMTPSNMRTSNEYNSLLSSH